MTWTATSTAAVAHRVADLGQRLRDADDRPRNSCRVSARRRPATSPWRSAAPEHRGPDHRHVEHAPRPARRPSARSTRPPTASTGVTGSIAVTGWAIDDIEVTGVRILRDPVAGRARGHADASSATRCSSTARGPTCRRCSRTRRAASRAGWGYLMLTNFLPNLGNGTFRLHAIADDADGHSTILGTKTITCTNSTATTPFGAIDTPGQGGTVSGTTSRTSAGCSRAGRAARIRRRRHGAGRDRRRVHQRRPRRMDEPSGSDGAVPRGAVSGRSAPRSAWPRSTPRALTNGVHTIAWVVTDNLGSRGRHRQPLLHGVERQPGARLMPSACLRRGSARDGRRSSNANSAASGRQAPASSGRRGFDLDDAAADVCRPRRRRDDPGGGARSHRAAAGARRSTDQVEGTFTGYLRVAGGLAPLPIGSALNAATGAFTWQPGVGFVGPYDLVFARWENGRAVARQDVRIVLNREGQQPRRAAGRDRHAGVAGGRRAAVRGGGLGAAIRERLGTDRRRHAARLGVSG